MKRLILLCAVLWSTPVWASDRQALADEYVRSMVAQMDMGQLIRHLYEPILDQYMAATQATITPAQKMEIHALFTETFSEPMRGILLAQAESMGALYTEEELRALIAFTATPEGRSVMQKMPQLMAQSQPDILTMVQFGLPRVMSGLQEIIAN